MFNSPTLSHNFTKLDIDSLPLYLRGTAIDLLDQRETAHLVEVEQAKEKCRAERHPEPILNLLAWIKTELKNENRSCASKSMDVEDENGLTLHEKIGVINDESNKSDLKIKSRSVKFNEHTENSLNPLRNSAASWGRNKGLTARRGQQIIQQNISDHEQQWLFKNGDKGQGGLFDFDGEVS